MHCYLNFHIQDNGIFQENKGSLGNPKNMVSPLTTDFRCFCTEINFSEAAGQIFPTWFFLDYLLGLFGACKSMLKIFRSSDEEIM